MSRTRLLLCLTALAAGLVSLSVFIADRMQWHTGVAAVGGLLIAWGAMSLWHMRWRRRLREQLQQMAPAQVEALAELSPDIRYALPSPGRRSVGWIVGIGHLGVSLPALLGLIAPLYLLDSYFRLQPPLPHFAALASGLVAAWLWWSVSVSFWRRWAMRQGLSADEVQHHGERASLLWHRDAWLARTEWGRWNMPRDGSSGRE